jgi:hypothetical protein
MNGIDQSFEFIFDRVTKLFVLMYHGGQSVFAFLFQPLSENIDPDYVGFLGDIVEWTPVELMFSFGLIFALVNAFIKFFTPSL